MRTSSNLTRERRRGLDIDHTNTIGASPTEKLISRWHVGDQAAPVNGPGDDPTYAEEGLR